MSRPATAVLALHGWLGRGQDWAAVGAALGGDTWVIAPDLPGHGSSEAGPQAFTMEGAAAGVLATLDDTGRDQAIIVGYSIGGRLALHLALEHPSRVAGLVLISASAGLRTHGERAERLAQDIARAEALVADPVAFVSDWYDQPLFDPMPAPLRAALVVDRLANGEPDGWARALVGLSVGAQPWHGDRTHEIRVPAAVLAGAVDAKFSAIAREIAAAGAFHATILPGAGHALLVERPDAVARAVSHVIGDW